MEGKAATIWSTMVGESSICQSSVLSLDAACAPLGRELNSSGRGCVNCVGTSFAMSRQGRSWTSMCCSV